MRQRGERACSNADVVECRKMHACLKREVAYVIFAMLDRALSFAFHYIFRSLATFLLSPFRPAFFFQLIIVIREFSSLIILP